MREIGSLPAAELANRFVSFLQTQSVPASADEEDGTWTIWVRNDDDRDRSRQMLQDFISEPDAHKYRAAPAEAKKKKQAAKASGPTIGKRDVQLKKRWSGDWRYAYPATQILIGLCIAVVAFGTQWSPMERGMMGLPDTCNDETSVLRNAMFIQAPVVVQVNGQPSARFLLTDWKKTLLATIASGEIWRPLTPIFLHFGVVHILFNMMWLKQLGQAVEFVRGTKRFVLLVLILGVTSNLVQYAWSGPAFGGMSGVVFGLIGYIWMKGRTQPQLGLGMMQNQVVYAILWLLLCMGGAMGPIANGAHLGGFIVGILIGARQLIWRRLRELIRL